MKNVFRYLCIGLLVLATAGLSVFSAEFASRFRSGAVPAAVGMPEDPFESEDDMTSDVSDNESAAETAVSSDDNTSVEQDPSSKTAVSSGVKAESQPKPEPPVEENNIDLIDYTKAAKYSEIKKQIKILTEHFPELVTSESAGTSVLGREIFLLKLGTGSKKALLVGAMHAREHITASYLLRCVEDYSRAYYSEDGLLDGYNIKKLLDEYTLYVVPNCNPDGSEIVLSKGVPAVSVNVTKRSKYKANANGVNLNRNFPFIWEDIVPETNLPDEAKYIGSSSGSEPETQALINLCKQNDFEWMLSFHIQGDCVYWSDAVSVDAGGVSETYANLLCKKYDLYKCPTSTDTSLFGGGFENWFRKEYGRPGFCVELMPLDYDPRPSSNHDNLRFEAALRYSLTRGIAATMMSGR